MVRTQINPEQLRRDPEKLMEGVVALENLLHKVGQKIIMPAYRSQSYTKTIKPDGSPVLSVDLDSSAALEAALPRIINAAVVSEENDVTASEFHWAIDPLDGTAEFVDETNPANAPLLSGKFFGTGHGGFCIKAYLAFQGAILVGAIHCPVQNKTFSSIEGGASWIRTGLGQRRVIKVHDPYPSLFTDQTLNVVFNAKSNPMTRYTRLKTEFAQRGVYLSDTPLTRPGLPRNLQVLFHGVDLHLGRDGYGWDLGADALILKNAGAAMFRLEDGTDLRFDTPRVLGGPYVAARDPLLREKLFPALKKN